ncbi:MAG: hypothetical protein HY509_03335 [Acidobacteria bacterium]|nr:hypothetical protein [Acidobacteriota bacterium]
MVGGWVGIPAVLGGGDRLGAWLGGALPGGRHGEHPSAGLEYGLMLLAAAAGLLGVYLSWRWTVGRPGELGDAFGGLRRVLERKWYVDELYDRAVVEPYWALCRASDRFDARVIDGAVNAGGTLGAIAGHVLKLFQTGYLRNYALSFLAGAAVILWLFLR